MQVDTTGWSGDGAFTQLLIDALREVPGIAALRVEDAPASRADTGYNFIANEVFVTFASATRREPSRLLGVIPYLRKRRYFLLDLQGLTARLAGTEKIGEPDYTDDGLIQYLRTERIVPPYQTRGVKIIELVRIYRAGPDAGRRNGAR